MKAIQQQMVIGLFVALVAMACGGPQKSRGAKMVEEEKDPDLVAELTGIDENTHVEVDEADRETSQTPSGMAPEAAGMGRDEDAIGGSKGAFFATMMVSGKEVKGKFDVRKADAEGSVVRENVSTGTDISLDPGLYDFVFQTKNIVGEPEFTLRDVKIEAGRRVRREVKIPTGEITLVTGAHCARKPLKIKLKGATEWYKGNFSTCKPITLMAGEYDAEVGSGRGAVPVSGIQVYDGGVRDVLIRSKGKGD
jgi:hypothetical protein